MAKRQFNPKSFFRKLRPDIQSKLAGQLNLLDAMEEEPPEGEPPQDRMYFAWTRVSDDIHKASDRDLRRINDLCCDKGRFYVDRALEAHLASHPTLLEQVREMSHYDAAATLFLECSANFDKAYGDFFIDDLTFRVKRQAKDERPIAIEAGKKQLVKARVEEFFVEKRQGQRQCQVEDHEDAERYALFVFHEHRVKYEDRFERGQLVSEMRQPVGLGLLVYYKETGVLTIDVRTQALRERLIEVFGKIYFRDARHFDDPFADEFDLSPLCDRDRRYEGRALDGIGSVGITEITFEHPDNDVGKLTLKCPHGHVAALDALKIPLDAATFQGVKIEIRPDGVHRKRKRTINITLPDRWNLNDTPPDRVLARYVETWGFSKKVVPHDDASAGAMDDVDRIGEMFRDRLANRYAGQGAGLAH